MPKKRTQKRLNKINDVTLQISLKEMMENFIMYKKVCGISPRTESDYNKYFRLFKKNTNINYLEYIEYPKLKNGVTEHFLNYTDKAPATYNLHYAYLNSFFAWCVEQNYFTQNPIKEIGLKKKKDEPKLKNLKEDVFKKLLDIMDISTFAGYRDYTIALLTIDTGIRPQEILSLCKIDVNLPHGHVTVNRDIAKTRTERILPISQQTIIVIKKLISIIPSDWGDYLFYTCEGAVMTVATWEKRLKYYGKKLGIRITPYMLRHSFAIYYLKNGGNVFALQKELGHTDLSMTRRYINLTNDDLKEQHVKASPVNMFIQRTTRIRKLFK
jgi:integrase